jgi:hypothetical protein
MIQSKRMALIYGDSVFLEGLAETLSAPDFALMEAEQAAANQLAELMRFFPLNHSPPIICLNGDFKQMTVIFAQQFPAASLDDLMRVLEKLFQPPNDIVKGET